MLHLAMVTNGSGKAADTGSAVHKAIEAWHKNGQDFRKAVAVMKAAHATYPLADLHDAALSFRPYTEDPRNIEAEIVCIEKPVTFTLPPSVLDPTKKEIVVTGTLDQVRRVDGLLYLYDVKTGDSMEGWEMLHHYAMQVAAYSVGAGVLPGALIRTRSYRKRGVRASESPPGVFWEYALTLDQCHTLLESVRNTVALIRSGNPHAGPGDHCRYCPAGGIDTCIPYLETRNVRRDR